MKEAYEGQDEFMRKMGWSREPTYDAQTGREVSYKYVPPPTLIFGCCLPVMAVVASTAVLLWLF